MYALKQAKDVQALKAVSQNLMHSNLSITDGVYGILSESDVRGQIISLGQKIATDQNRDTNQLLPLLMELVEELKKS